MELIEFIRIHRDCLNLSGIENRLGIERGTLKEVLRGNRTLSDGYGKLMIDYFSNYSVRLHHVYVDKRKKVKKFDTTGWKKVFGRNWEKDGKMVLLDEDGFYSHDVN